MVVPWYLDDVNDSHFELAHTAHYSLEWVLDVIENENLIYAAKASD